jgi:hypothetical protein
MLTSLDGFIADAVGDVGFSRNRLEPDRPVRL